MRFYNLKIIKLNNNFMINSFSENKNITSPKKQEEDHKNDSNLRPLSF